MQRLIKNGELIENEWRFVESASESGNGKVILPLAEFLKAGVHDENVGVRISAEDDADALRPYIKNLALIELYFEKFADGRSFSQARFLRDALDYNQEIRASGDFMLDQIFYLSRCGVDAFLLPEGASLETAQKNLHAFSETYQAAYDEAQPLFRRRV